MAATASKVNCPQCGRIQWWPDFNQRTYLCGNCLYRITFEDMLVERLTGERNMLTASFTWQHQLNMYKLKFDQIQGDQAWKQLKSLLDLIKGTIPAGIHRDYDPETKEWFISQDYEQFVRHLLEQTIGQKNVFFFQKPEDTGVNIGKTLTVQDELNIFSKYANISVPELQKLDKANATKLYRQLALKYHPDRDSRNGPMMSEINAVWSSLKEGYYIK